MVINKLRVMGGLWADYRRFTRSIGLGKTIVLQILGIISCLLNLLGIVSLFPFISIFMNGQESFIQRYVRPYWSGELPPFLADHFLEVSGLLIAVSFILKALFLIAYAGLSSNYLEEYSARIRKQINLDYLYSLGKTLKRDDKSNVIYLNGQVVQLTSFNWGLLDLNLKIYVFVTTFIFLVRMSLGLSMFSILLVGVIVIVGMPIYRWTRHSAHDFYTRLRQFQAQMVAFLDGADVIKSLNLLPDQIDGFDKTNREIRYSANRMSLSRQAMYSLPEVIMMVAMVAMVMATRSDRTQLVFIATYFYALRQLVSALSDMSQRLNNTLELQKVPNDIYSYLDHRPISQSVDVQPSQSLPAISEIELKNVTIRDGDKYILNPISVRFPVGKKIQLVGRNGSGKSSLIKSLMKMMPYEGEIFINGIDLRSISDESLYDRIAYHGQNQFLFNDTVMNNILRGNPEKTEQDVRTLCAESGLEQVIFRLEKGYDTLVAESASNLSGGEKQSICIARTLLRDAEVMVFDEFTNHLDRNVSERITAYFAGIRQKTLFFVTHKPLPFCDLTVDLGSDPSQ